jgi:hypothetical protein
VPVEEPSTASASDIGRRRRHGSFVPKPDVRHMQSDRQAHWVLGSIRLGKMTAEKPIRCFTHFL